MTRFQFRLMHFSLHTAILCWVVASISIFGLIEYPLMVVGPVIMLFLVLGLIVLILRELLYLSICQQIAQNQQPDP